MLSHLQFQSAFEFLSGISPGRAPGPILVPTFNGRLPDPTFDRTPIQQFSSIAALAVFLLSRESAHITGQTLHVNGGEFLY